MTENWWDREWFWVLCVLLPLLAALFAPELFREVSQAEALVRAVPLSVAMVFAYYVRRSGSLSLYRLIAVAGGGGLGFLVGIFSLAALGIRLPLSLDMILLLGTTVAGAMILDRFMARRDYQPFV